MLTFRSDEEKEEILLRSLAGVPEEALYLGEKYRTQIESGYLPKVSVRRVSDEVGDGLFAEETIVKGSYVGEYAGVVRPNSSIDALSHYSFLYPAIDPIGRNYVIDAICGNLTRTINHSAKPNLKPHYAYLDGFYRILLLAIEEITVGTQFTFDYGPNYWLLRGKPVNI